MIVKEENDGSYFLGVQFNITFTFHKDFSFIITQLINKHHNIIWTPWRLNFNKHYVKTL